jgi:hypothetical protein
MTLDTKLRWKPHVKKKQEELNLKYRKMYWLMGRYSALSIYKSSCCTNRFSSQYGLIVFNFGVVPAKATEISYSCSRIQYSVVSWMPLGTFAMKTLIKIWMWQLSIASSNSMLKGMNNAYIGISM